MEEIKNNAELNKSIKRGISDSELKKGRLADRYPQLRNQPHYGNNIKKLINYKPETWRYRIGKYRVFYITDEESKIVNLISIDLRKDSY